MHKLGSASSMANIAWARNAGARIIGTTTAAFPCYERRNGDQIRLWRV